jgi:hypothetical protein
LDIASRYCFINKNHGRAGEMNRKLEYFLPLIALASGFLLGLCVAGVHSTFFILVPIMAFIMGYFTSWGRGLVYSILLFSSYTFTLALMWEVRWAFVGISQYFGAFFGGGFAILLLGALAPIARNGIKNTGAVIVLVLLIVIVAGCSYLSVPRYRYSYSLYIMCTQDMEIYVPTAVASNDFSTRLLKSAKSSPNVYGPDWYDVQLEDTEYGKMWHLKMYSHLSANPDPRQPGRSSNWNTSSGEIRSWPGQSTNKMAQIASKYNVAAVDKVIPSGLSWPQVITQGRVSEEFNVPIKVRTDTETEFQVNLSINVERISGINFGYSKDEGYIETVDWFKGTTGDQWIMVPAEAKKVVSIRGTGD